MLGMMEKQMALQREVFIGQDRLEASDREIRAASVERSRSDDVTGPR